MMKSSELPQIYFKCTRCGTTTHGSPTELRVLEKYCVTCFILKKEDDKVDEWIEEDQRGIVTEKEIVGLANFGVMQYPNAVPKKGLYYDLVKLPHGHIPVSKIKFWGSLSIPIREFRDYGYFKCPECGSPSFFRLISDCGCCGAFTKDGYSRYKKRLRKRRIHGFLKRLEVALLPLLVYAGKAYYVRSVRGHWMDAGEPNTMTVEELRKQNIYYSRVPPTPSKSNYMCDHQ